jgi:cytochrome c-type biogenesis protein CcmH/NrfF
VARKIKKKSETGIPARRSTKPSFQKIVAVLASVFAVGFFVAGAFFKEDEPSGNVISYQSPPPANGSLERQVQRVASNFKCACGGCGELPLAECTCDMPRGAREEKDFIRNKLQEGLSVDQVVQLVQEAYGHMIT